MKLRFSTLYRLPPRTDATVSTSWPPAKKQVNDMVYAIRQYADESLLHLCYPRCRTLMSFSGYVSSRSNQREFADLETDLWECAQLNLSIGKPLTKPAFWPFVHPESEPELSDKDFRINCVKMNASRLRHPANENTVLARPAYWENKRIVRWLRKCANIANLFIGMSPLNDSIVEENRI